jgi:hypothetical protein
VLFPIFLAPNVVVDTPTTYSGGVGLDSWPRRPTILMEVSRGFPESLQANAGIIPKIRPRPLPTKAFPIHHSLTILLIDPI